MGEASAGPRAGQVVWGDEALPFVAVGRAEDATTLAYSFSCDYEEQLKEKTMGIFKKLLAAAKKRLAPNEKLRLSWNEGSVCCLMDREGVLVYCVVTSLVTYPERLAYQLLYDLVVAVNALDQSEVLQCGENALTGKLMQRMKELVKQYEDPNNFPMLQRAMDPLQVSSSGGRDFAHGGDARLSDRRKKLMIGLAMLMVLVVIIIIVLCS